MLSFRQLYEYIEEDTFSHEGHEYSLKNLKKLIKGRPVKSILVSKLKWIFEYDDPKKDHPERIATANVEQPILVTLDPKERRWVVLDGLHRLAKAVRKGMKELPSITITQADLKKCLVK